MPTLDTYRKQAKQLLRWHRERDLSIGGRVRVLDRYRDLSDREILELDLGLVEAQEIVAREAGFQSWTELKATAEGAPKTPRPSDGPPVLGDAAPILMVRDVGATAAWFEARLGFSIDWLHGQPPFYAQVSRDQARLHLRFVADPLFATMAEAEGELIATLIEVSDAGALHDEFVRRGAEIAQAPTRHPWGGVDFHVRDLDGNVLGFVAMG